MSSVEAYEGYPKYLVQAALSNGETLAVWLSSYATIEPQGSYPNYGDASPADDAEVAGIGAYEGASPSLDTALLEGLKSALESFDWSGWGWSITSVTVTATKFTETKTAVSL